MKAIRLQRFKGFVDSGWIELKPINLLFGYNSSGKSSVLQALLVLKQSLENPSLEVPFVFTSQKGIDLGSFEEAVYNHEINHKKPMIISLRVNIRDFIEKIPQGFLLNNESKIENMSVLNWDIDYSIEISYNKKRRFITIIGFYICDSSGKLFLKMSKANPAQSAKENFTSDYFQDLNDKEIKLEWYNFLPIIKGMDLYQHPIVDITRAFREKVISSLKNISNIGPVRAVPERNQFFTGESPVNVGVRGEDAFKLLYLDKFNEKTKNLESKVNEWLFQYNYNYEWRIFKNSLGQFILTDTRTKVKVSIKDVGFGLSQILPIVVQVYNSGDIGTILIEQPEIHLHAKAQGELADLFISAIQNKLDNQKKIIIETHSEHILLRFQRRLAESCIGEFDKNFNVNDIAVYYIENPDGTSIKNNIVLNESGEIIEQPQSFKKFFSYDFQEVMKINQTLSLIKNKDK